MSKGFVTVATGDEKYYKLAAELYISYKRRGKGKYPFALVCDRKNKYSKIFDDVVLVDDVRRSTVDKLLMIHSPYDESIFIDADTLVLRNIDDLWEVFADQDDVSVFGKTLALDSQDGWFTYEGSGPYKSQIQYLIRMNGGIYFFRNTDKARKVYIQALDIINDYAQIDFKYFDTPQDEPLMAMSMVLNQCKPCEKKYDMLILPVCEKRIRSDYKGHVYDGYDRSSARLIHFSAPRTKLFLYHYLYELNHHGKKWRTFGRYLKIKMKYFPNDLRFNSFHFFGAILRKMGCDVIVENLKKRLQ